MGEDGPLPALTLRTLVAFPGTALPVVIGRRASIELMNQLDGVGARLLLGLQKDERTEEPTASDLHAICVEGTVSTFIVDPSGQRVLVLRGARRRRITKVTRERPFIVAESEVVQPEEEGGARPSEPGT
ncbi:MAG TPA: LON peptidase substrate-binding domain-containing protein [Polyangia bacterium]|nr:LON peptidase substrate-binding domain-containing protein [Polyangia bacterium]